MIKITRQERKNFHVLFSDFYQRASEARTGAVRVALWLRVWSALDTQHLILTFLLIGGELGAGHPVTELGAVNGPPIKVCVNTTEKGHLLKHIFLPAPSDSVITRQERKVKASVDEKMQVFCLTTTIYFQFLLSARAEWAGRGLEAGGRGRPLGSGRGLTLVTSGYDRIGSWSLLLLILLFLCSKRWGSCLGEESAASLHFTNNSNRRGKLMKYLCLYFALHTFTSVYFTSGGPGRERGRSAVVSRR